MDPHLASVYAAYFEVFNGSNLTQEFKDLINVRTQEQVFAYLKAFRIDHSKLELVLMSSGPPGCTRTPASFKDSKNESGRVHRESSWLEVPFLHLGTSSYLHFAQVLKACGTSVIPVWQQYA